MLSEGDFFLEERKKKVKDDSHILAWAHGWWLHLPSRREKWVLGGSLKINFVLKIIDLK